MSNNRTVEHERRLPRRLDGVSTRQTWIASAILVKILIPQMGQNGGRGLGAGPLVVTYPLPGRSRAIVEEELGGTTEAIYLVDLAPGARAHALGRAGAVLSHDTSKELRPDEIPLIRDARLLQFTAAGVDWVPTRDLPPELPVAANKGGGAEPMSEHIVALALAAAKRLFIEHTNLNSEPSAVVGFSLILPDGQLPLPERIKRQGCQRGMIGHCT